MIDITNKDKKSSLKILAGRDKSPDDYIYFERYNFGLNFVNNIGGANQIGMYCVHSYDNKNSILFDSSVLQPINIFLTGITGKFSFSKEISLNFEGVECFNNYEDYDKDYALTSALSYKKNKMLITLTYEKAGPYFFTPNGQITIDKEKFSGVYSNTYLNFLKIKTGSKFQSDNQKKQNLQTNYLFENFITADYNPFKNFKSPYLNKIAVQNNLNLRNNYNEYITGAANDIDIDNLLFNCKISNQLFNNIYSIDILLERENEDDLIADIRTVNRQTEINNNINYKKKLSSESTFTSKLKYSFKNVNGLIDNTYNYAASLNYTKKDINCLLDYYISLLNSGNDEKDKKNHKIGLTFDYNYKYGKVTNTYSLKVNYETNRFKFSENDSDKFDIFATLKIAFAKIL